MKLCVYFGTFNPIHNAHLAVANFIKSNFNFDKILFIPAYKPPHKKDINNSLAIHRLNMVNLAISDEKTFQLSDIEYKKENYSYTYFTIQELYKQFPNIEGKINFLIGTDAFKQFPTWYEADKLKDLIKFLVFPRENNLNPHQFDYLKEKNYDFELVNCKFLDIASSEIRSKIKNNDSIKDLLPEKVINYINEYNLYREEENENNI